MRGHEAIPHRRDCVAVVVGHLQAACARSLGYGSEEKECHGHTYSVDRGRACRPSPKGLKCGMVSVTRIANAALDLVYPKRCVACGRFGLLLCPPCAAEMEPAYGAPGRCPMCHGAWAGPLNCPRCTHWDALDGGFAAFEMAGPARKAVHALKYGGVREVAGVIARVMEPMRSAAPFELSFPVPLHRSRVRSRGFNQADLILGSLGWPAARGQLRRNRKTRTQVGLHLRERRTNVSGAFSYAGPELTGKDVALIDDVITTGATANECAKVLRDHGARRVWVFAFARASHEGDGPPRD